MTWQDINKVEMAKPYYENLQRILQWEYDAGECYPPYPRLLTALALTALEDVKCVIIGQDPYHNPHEAMGLSFSVPKGIPIPPSLRNIYQELHEELGCIIPSHGDLTDWAKQGVLLLNSVLSVRAHAPASHRGIGWEQYTDALIKAVGEKESPVVYMLWGNFARSKKYLIKNPNHLILEARHPSPFSANHGFFGCGHFKKCNDYLSEHGITPIDWQIR